MRLRQRGVVALIALAAAVIPVRGFAWGDRTHLALTRLAIGTLRGECAHYFTGDSEELISRSLEPDTVLRRRDGHAEEIRHFINLDSLMAPPFEGFPRDFRAASDRFGRKFLERNGIVPWVILRFERELHDALRRDDHAEAVRKAAYLSHYIADSFQPLHLTRDYDGRLSGNAGVHRRYENDYVDARIDEFLREVGARLGPAALRTDLRKEVFDALFETYPAVDHILTADRAARDGGKSQRREYARRMEKEIGDMTRFQLWSAAALIGGAWTDACSELRRVR